MRQFYIRTIRIWIKFTAACQQGAQGGVGCSFEFWKAFGNLDTGPIIAGWLLETLDTPRSSFLNIVETKIFVARAANSFPGRVQSSPQSHCTSPAPFWIHVLTHFAHKTHKKIRNTCVLFPAFLSEGTKDNNFRQGPLLIAGRQSVC